VSKPGVWEIRDSRISGIAHTALAACVKEVEYGPAELEAGGNAVTLVQRVAMAHTGTRVVIDGRTILPEDVDIDRLYQEGYTKK
jgi:hypothetical protein